MGEHRVVSHEEWIDAPTPFLAREKELTRLRDRLSEERRNLPWERVDKHYAFDGPNGTETLSDLFAGRSQLIVYHFMFGPDWEAGCPSCSLLADGFNGVVVHLAQRDVSFVVVSHAPVRQAGRLLQAHGLGLQVDVVRGQRFQPRLPGLVHAR